MEEQGKGNGATGDPDRPTRPTPPPAPKPMGKIAENTEDGGNRNRTPSGISTGKWGNYLERLDAAVGALTLLAVCFAAYIYWGQLQEMRTATEATASAAKSAEDAVRIAEESLQATTESFRLDQRAWVGLETATLTMRPNSPVSIRVRFTNSGSTPALNCATLLGMTVQEEELNDAVATDLFKAFVSTGPPAGDPGSVFPGNGFSTSVSSQEVYTTEMIDEIRSEKKYIYLFGYVTYSDIFDKENERRTSFMLVYRPANNRFSAIGGGNEAN